MLLFSIVAGLGISRIMSKESILYGVISGFIIMILGFIFIRKPKEPMLLKETDMPPLPEEPVNKEMLNNKALDIFIDGLNREIMKAESRMLNGTTEISNNNANIE